MSSGTGPDREALLAALREASVRLNIQTGFYSDAAAANLGLNRIDVDCLNIMLLEGPVTAGRLVEATGITTGGISGVIDRLEKEGFVSRESDPDDRRRVIVRLAPDRAARLAALFAPLGDATGTIYERYNDGEIALVLGHTERNLSALQTETARLRNARAGEANAAEDDGIFSAPLGDTKEATLELVGGAHTIQVRGDAAMADLFRARFEGSGVRVVERNGIVSVSSRSRLLGERLRGEILLNPSLPWAFRVSGGSNQVSFELADVGVLGIEVVGGATTAEFTLRAPSGTVPIRISGGANRLTIRRPSAVPVRAELRGGSADIRVDREDVRPRYGAAWESPGYATTTGRLAITFRGGSTRLEVTVNRNREQVTGDR